MLILPRIEEYESVLLLLVSLFVHILHVDMIRAPARRRDILGEVRDHREEKEGPGGQGGRV